LKLKVLYAKDGKILKYKRFSGKVFVCNKKARGLAGFLSLFLFYRIQRNSRPNWAQILRFRMNELEDFFGKGA